MKGRRTITDEMYASIPTLLADGYDRKQIAEMFGTKWQTLQVMCCKRNISLRHRDRPKLQKLALPPEPINLSPPRRRVLHDRARALGMDEATLAAQLLNLIIRDDLFVAVLDANNRTGHVNELA